MRKKHRGRKWRKYLLKKRLWRWKLGSWVREVGAKTYQ